jgi:rare lipoprotein A
VVSQALPAVSSEPLPPPRSSAERPPPEQPQAFAPAPEPTLSQIVTLLPVHPTHIYIQAGAFAVDGNAQSMKQRLAGLGPVFINGIRVNGLRVYRVRLGPIDTVDEADRLRDRAIQAGATSARIVVD